MLFRVRFWIPYCLNLRAIFQLFLVERPLFELFSWRLDVMASFSLECDGFFPPENLDGLSDDPFVNAGILPSQNNANRRIILDPNYSDISDDEKDFEPPATQSRIRYV